MQLLALTMEELDHMKTALLWIKQKLGKDSDSSQLDHLVRKLASANDKTIDEMVTASAEIKEKIKRINSARWKRLDPNISEITSFSDEALLNIKTKLLEDLRGDKSQREVLTFLNKIVDFSLDSEVQVEVAGEKKAIFFNPIAGRD